MFILVSRLFRRDTKGWSLWQDLTALLDGHVRSQPALLKVVLRIRNVYLGSGSDHFFFIPDADPTRFIPDPDPTKRGGKINIFFILYR
jgi:hypothetical protein